VLNSVSSHLINDFGRLQSHLSLGGQGRGPLPSGKLNFLFFALNTVILLLPEARHSGGRG
jgi:hypothetical protein